MQCPRQSLFRDIERSAHENSVTYLHIGSFPGHWAKSFVLWWSLLDSASQVIVHEDKIISLGVMMTQAA